MVRWSFPRRFPPEDRQLPMDESARRSFIEKREHQFAFRDDRVVNDAITFGFCHAFAARSGELGMNEHGVPRKHRFAKLYAVRAHEIPDAARRFRPFE